MQVFPGNVVGIQATKVRLSDAGQRYLSLNCHCPAVQVTDWSSIYFESAVPIKASTLKLPLVRIPSCWVVARVSDIDCHSVTLKRISLPSVWVSSAVHPANSPAVRRKSNRIWYFVCFIVFLSLPSAPYTEFFCNQQGSRTPADLCLLKELLWCRLINIDGHCLGVSFISNSNSTIYCSRAICTQCSS